MHFPSVLLRLSLVSFLLSLAFASPVPAKQASANADTAKIAQARSKIKEALDLLDAELGQQPNNQTGANGAKAKPAAAVFLNLNLPDGNKVIGIPVNPRTGRLLAAQAILTPTGGTGGIGLTAGANGSAPTPAAVDPLFSQGAVTAAGNLVLAVNAGSNTVTLFRGGRGGNRATLQPVGSPAPTLGEFPVSVAFNPDVGVACVLNGGKVDGVTCYRVDAKTGLTAMDAAPRPLGLGQSTPPVGPLGTASHVLFDREAGKLLVTVKGDPGAGREGFLGSFDVDASGNVGTELRRSVPEGSKVLFGSAVARKGGETRVVATDAAFGAVTFGVDAEGQAVSVAAGNATAALTVVEGQKATCWAAFSPATETAFVTDIGKGRVVEVDPFDAVAPGKIVGTVEVDGVEGMIDLAVGGDFAYALAPAEGRAVVLDIRKGRGKAKVAQTVPVACEKSTMGMAVLF
ncbi:hypothetical protein HDU96_000791 [Phlyctochytrium bullatum]|nr:hypothetical protein HDU96_000791 [Phlyctochytrium bullatum]